MISWESSNDGMIHMWIVLVCTLLNDNKAALEKNLFKKADVGISLYKHKISISYF